MQHCPTTITLTVTNGVSFSLVAGACCVVHINNTTYTKAHTNITLNINSTGAKGVQLQTEAYGSQYQTPSGGSIITLTQYYAVSKCQLFIYNGSVYIAPRSTFAAYPDYGDYQD